jgi:dTDP-glucose 4,6-dehydratase
MNTAVVTGGAGFIGSHLCHRLLEEGFKVICIDNLLTGHLINIDKIKEKNNFSFINHDVTKFISLKGKVDFILHFASPASPSDYLEFPIQTLKVGSIGTHNALGLAKEKKARFLLASTSEVYGDPQIHPQNENYWGHVNPIGPRGVYDEAKRFAEALTMAYHKHHKIETRIARIFNTYGPSMRANDGRAIPNFIIQSLNNQPLTVYGDGKQTRSFCYISDMIDGLFKLLMSDLNEPINLGSAEEISILELAKKIMKLQKSKSEILFKDLPEDDPKIRQPDITKAKEELKWKPKVTLENGLEKTVEYFRSFNLS